LNFFFLLLINIKNNGDLSMNKICILALSLGFFLFSIDVSANHCSGGHKEIKETTDTSSEKDEDSKSN
jgi:hypothetical protein